MISNNANNNNFEGLYWNHVDAIQHQLQGTLDGYNANCAQGQVFHNFGTKLILTATKYLSIRFLELFPRRYGYCKCGKSASKN
jgi:hypothetical protein